TEPAGFNLILLDLMMPVMDGRAFLEARATDPKLLAVPVVVLSAYRDLNAPELSKNVLCAMRKPIKLAELSNVVRDVCCAGGR
ncbi:MAG TPA: hypothetical protein VK898_08015, partial [Chloroflexota bacterium]|nr:hypothetical protein [Chloroflexota bacterium]